MIESGKCSNLFRLLVEAVCVMLAAFSLCLLVSGLQSENENFDGIIFDAYSWINKDYIGRIFGGRNEKPIYRLGEIISNASGKISGTIRFVWD